MFSISTVVTVLLIVLGIIVVFMIIDRICTCIENCSVTKNFFRNYIPQKEDLKKSPAELMSESLQKLGEFYKESDQN